MRPLNASLLMSVVVAGSLIAAGSAAWGQRGGYSGGHGGYTGHAGGFSSRGFSGSITGFPGQISTLAPHAIATPGRAVYPTSAHAFVPGFVPSERPGFQPSWGGRGGDRSRDRRGYRSGYRGGYGAYGYPLYGSSWELLPYDLGYSDFSGDTEDQSTAQPAETAPPPDTGYRPEYEGGPYPAGSPYDYAPPPPAAAAAPLSPEPELTLIFKDGHTQAIHNYVLTQTDLVDLDEAASGRQQRIPLNELNLPATEQAAQQAGLDFSPPA